MSTVKVNRELLTDLVEDLDERHGDCDTCRFRPCPTWQRLGRIKGVLNRTPVDGYGVGVGPAT